MKKSIHVPAMKLRAIAALLLLLIAGFGNYAKAQSTAYLKYGNSYVNISKKTTGGTVTTGDTLEIRTTFYINSAYNNSNSGTNGGSGRIYAVRYLDSLPRKTDTINYPLKRITNEGVQSRSYTLTANDDAGTFIKNPLLPNIYQIRINLGGPTLGVEPTRPTLASATSTTDVVGASSIQGNSNPPKFGSGTLTTVAFRVKVTGVAGDTIVLGAAKIIYKKTSAGVDTTINFTPYKIIISASNAAFCSNATGATFTGEAGGTFDSGTVLNRSYAPSFSIPGYTYINNVSRSVGINDGYYAVVKNTSPLSSTQPNSRRQGAGGGTCSAPSPIPTTDSCANRMFGGFWFINGDHTGTNNSAGKSPPAAATRSGYMLVVNADISQSEAYRQTISGLCPDTYYEFSAWVRNVCPLCGIDSSGTQTWKPGVLPNLTFVVDGLDYYSSGDIDTLGWLKRGFVVKTDTAQTSFTISIRNNAPGGGGNDWALDDISLASCTPDISITPGSGLDSTCYGNSINFSATITSSYNNMNWWKWQKSTNNGSSWSDVTTGNTTPTWNGLAWTYTVNLNLTNVPSSDSGALYRAVFAPTFGSLTNASCNVISNSIRLIVRTIYDPAGVCKVLPVKIVNFSARKDNNNVKLIWTSENEQPNVLYELERSSDGTTFIKIGSQDGRGLTMNAYSYIDAAPLKGINYYRAKVIDTRTGKIFYTNIAVVYTDEGKQFDLISVLNPFKSNIYVTLSVANSGTVKMQLNNMQGGLIRNYQQSVIKGVSQIQMPDLSSLPAGMYLLRIEMGNDVVVKKVYKMN